MRCKSAQCRTVNGQTMPIQVADSSLPGSQAEPPVVVGGFASGRGHVLVPPPADAAERPASGRGTKQGARYAMAGLVFCSPRDGAAAGGCAAPAGAHVAGPPCGPAAGDAAPADARHLSAAALSVTGTGPLPRSSMLLVDDAALVDQVDDEGELLVGLELGALAVSGEERGIAMNVLLQECMRCKVSPGRMELAVWDTQRAPDCATALLEGKGAQFSTNTVLPYCRLVYIRCDRDTCIFSLHLFVTLVACTASPNRVVRLLLRSAAERAGHGRAA